MPNKTLSIALPDALREEINAAVDADYGEIAHISARDIVGTNFIGGGNDTDHWYFHDIELTDHNRGVPLISSNKVFGMFSSNMDWFAIENFQSLDMDSYFWRGVGVNCDNCRF